MQSDCCVNGFAPAPFTVIPLIDSSTNLTKSMSAQREMKGVLMSKVNGSPSEAVTFAPITLDGWIAISALLRVTGPIMVGHNNVCFGTTKSWLVTKLGNIK